MAEQGIAGTEIIQRHTASHLLQCGHETGAILDILKAGGLGDLDCQSARDLGLVLQQPDNLTQSALVARGQA